MSATGASGEERATGGAVPARGSPRRVRVLQVACAVLALALAVPAVLFVRERPETWKRRLPWRVRNLLFGTHAGGQETDGAIAPLRTVARRQAEFMERAAVDLDGDGRGEAATASELTGLVGLRASPDGALREARLSPALLGPDVRVERGTGLVDRRGYVWVLCLPGRDGACARETGPGGPLTAPVDTDRAEVSWWAYAWPRKWGTTGEAAYFIDQSGVLWACGNQVARWSGPDRPPPFERPLDTAAADAEGRLPPGPDGEVWLRRDD